MTIYILVHVVPYEGGHIKFATEDPALIVGELDRLERPQSLTDLDVLEHEVQVWIQGEEVQRVVLSDGGGHPSDFFARETRPRWAI